MHRHLVKVAFGVVFWGVWAISVCPAAEYVTRNFRVNAPTADIAKQVGETAEHFRRQIAKDWLGYELPRWAERCPIKVKVGQIGAGGQTTFNFHPVAKGPAEVCDWKMEVQGSLERILDSVVPHEVSHTIFACHFRRPLPRWADEGAATLVECESERRVQVLTVEEVIKTRRRIPLKELLAMKDYPKDPQAVRTLYAEGYSLAHLLVQEGGRAKFLKFLEDAHQRGWEKAISQHYPHAGIGGLESHWKEWVLAGSPEIDRNPKTLVADANAASPAVARGQTPDEEEPVTRPSPKSRPRSRETATDSRGLTAPAPKRKNRGEAAMSEDSGLGAAEEEDPVVAATEPPRKARELPQRSTPPQADGDRPPRRTSPRDVADNSSADLEADDLGMEEDLDRSRGRDRRGESDDDLQRPAPRKSTQPAPGRAIARGKQSPSREMADRGRRTPYSEFPDDARPQVTLMPNDLR